MFIEKLISIVSRYIDLVSYISKRQKVASLVSLFSIFLFSIFLSQKPNSIFSDWDFSVWFILLTCATAIYIIVLPIRFVIVLAIFGLQRREYRDVYKATLGALSLSVLPAGVFIRDNIKLGLAYQYLQARRNSVYAVVVDRGSGFLAPLAFVLVHTFELDMTGFLVMSTVSYLLFAYVVRFLQFRLLKTTLLCCCIFFLSLTGFWLQGLAILSLVGGNFLLEEALQLWAYSLVGSLIPITAFGFGGSEALVGAQLHLSSFENSLEVFVGLSLINLFGSATCWLGRLSMRGSSLRRD